MNFLTSESFPPQRGLLLKACYPKKRRLQSDLGFHVPPLQCDQFCKLCLEVANPHSPLRTGEGDTSVQELLSEVFPLCTTIRVDLVPIPLPYTRKAVGLLTSAGMTKLGSG